jgi:hypothetical protein
MKKKKSDPMQSSFSEPESPRNWSDTVKQTLAEPDDLLNKAAPDFEFTKTGYKTREVEPTPADTNATQYAINDAPSLTDSIGFQPFVVALSRLIRHSKTQTPLTVGVIGPWGSGKSSFMAQVSEHVRSNAGDTKVRQIWFNAWNHDVHDKLWVSLLQCVFNALEQGLNPFVRYWLRMRVVLARVRWPILAAQWLIGGLVIYYLGWVLGQSLVEAAKASDNTILRELIDQSPAWLGALIALRFLYPSFAKGVLSFMRPSGVNLSVLLDRKNFAESVADINDFNARFNNLLDTYLSEDGRLVVYIDDLDRCTPNQAVEVIETLNLFLSSPRCVFLLGIDRDKLALSVEAKYRELIELERSQQRMHQDSGEVEADIHQRRRYGINFLEKIIQLPLLLPVPNREETESLAAQILAGPAEPSQAEAPNRPTDTLPDLHPLDLHDSLQQVLVRVAGHHSHNPRTVKRFLNGFRFLHFLYVLNREQFPDINETVLPYWYFLVDRFYEELLAAYKDIVPPGDEELPLNAFFQEALPKCPEMQEFLDTIPENERESEWIGLMSSGRPVASYMRLTRYIHH